MNKLNLLVSFTDKNRRREERRSSHRRIIKYAFGTDNWVQAVRASYVFWPKQDRRSQERRNVTRRIVERRTRLRKYSRHAAFRQQTLRNQLPSQMLTEEERKMLSELSRHF